jgi:hypothetical protein
VRHFLILIALFALFLGAARVASLQSTTDPSTSSQLQSNAAPPANQGNGFIGDWLSWVTETQSEQPHWMTPLATTTPRLKQEFRFDVQTQPHNNGLVTDNFGVSKGFEIIPAKRWEVILAIPLQSWTTPIPPRTDSAIGNS